MIHSIPLVVAERIHQFLLADVLKELLTNYIFFNNGNLKMKILKNRYITKVVNYHQNWNLYEEFKLMNGVYEGKYVSYFYNGNKHTEAFYKDGRKDGIFKSYFFNGKLHYKQYYKNGIRLMNKLTDFLLTKNKSSQTQA